MLISGIGFAIAQPWWLLGWLSFAVMSVPALLWRAEVQGVELCCFVGRREVLRVDLFKTKSIQVNTDGWGRYKHRYLSLEGATVVAFSPVLFIGRLPVGWESSRVNVDLWATDLAWEKVLREWMDVIGPLTEEGAVPWTGGWHTTGNYDTSRWDRSN